MNRMLGILFASILLSLAGCGGGSPSANPPDQPVVGLLSQVTDTVAFEASLKASLTAMSTAAQLDAAAAAADRNFTGTYTQEQNVDEFDAVRYDGSHLFVAPRRYYHCCFILADASQDGAVSTGNDPQRSIRILATDPGNGSAQVAGSIPLEDNISVQGMYLADERMFALTGESIYGSYGELWADIAIWAPERLGYRIYDVSDASEPVLEVDATIDGIFVESRRIGNTVYIVSRYTPYIDGLHYYVTTAEQQAQNEQILADASLDDLLPKITINGETRTLVAPDHCYITTDDAAPYAVITSITAVPIDNPTAFSTTCYNEQTYGVYVSEDALYLTQLRPDTALARNITRIHKFALANTQVRYRGSADIEGTVWRGGQADFRMSEHQGDLRVLASQFDWTNEDFVDHKLYILRESNTSVRLDLDIVSTLPNANRPEEIGKPNEALYGVRFLADRAYAVTFMQIDPLYVLDLADPTDPYIAGELEITGFSDFLHPVNDDLLVGLGTGGNGGVKLELFDVSNIAQPLSRGSTTLGGRGSWSEAIHDRHAFTYQADVNDVNGNAIDRIAIPANLYSPDNNFSYYQSGLYLFEIWNKNTPPIASLNSAGSILPPADGTTIPFYSSRNRSFIHDDTVYYVRDEDVWAAFWHTPSVVNGPF
ncbi:MAG: beta-propeller domain-containing protein [Gammaproteobacteria bacterium]|nr:beta-propeller domain-containing protein [Gammaproteobacteria bacterium]